jgi:hypothetical protein
MDKLALLLTHDLTVLTRPWRSNRFTMPSTPPCFSTRALTAEATWPFTNDAVRILSVDLSGIATLALFTNGDFLPIHVDVARRTDAKAHVRAIHGHNYDLDVIANSNRLFDSAGEY